MTAKKRRRNLGKTIRQKTGLPLPVAMRAAKLIDRGDRWDLSTHPLTMDHTKAVSFSCGPECCGFKGYVLVGPRGEYDI
jgi:hypothetical protein